MIQFYIGRRAHGEPRRRARVQQLRPLWR